MSVFGVNDYTLPDGEVITVRELGPEDAPATEDVMAEAWFEAYVSTGMLSVDGWRRFVGRHRAGWLAEQIAKANETVGAGRTKRILFLGAFAADAHEQVGMLKYRGHRGGKMLRPVAVGVIDEMNTAPHWQRRGVGRVMANAAITHGLLNGHDQIALSVVQGNAPARAFYERHLGLRATGETSLGEGMPESMRRDEMSAEIEVANTTLLNANPWLAPAT